MQRLRRSKINCIVGAYIMSFILSYIHLSRFQKFATPPHIISGTQKFQKYVSSLNVTKCIVDSISSMNYIFTFSRTKRYQKY